MKSRFPKTISLRRLPIETTLDHSLSTVCNEETGESPLNLVENENAFGLISIGVRPGDTELSSGPHLQPVTKAEELEHQI